MLNAERRQSLPTFSIIIETDNSDSRHLHLLRRCLDSLARQGLRLHDARGVFLVVREEMAASMFDDIRLNYPWLTIVRADSDTRYIGLKLFGAGLSSSDVVMFCDADVSYAPGWVDAMLVAMRDWPIAAIVAGRLSALAQRTSIPRTT